MIAVMALTGAVATAEAAPKKKKSATRRTATTKAKAAAKTPTSAGITIDDFVFYASEPTYRRVFASRDVDSILDRLQKKGFNVSHRTETRDDDAGMFSETGTYEADIYTLTKTTEAGTTTIILDWNIDIEFPNQADAETFINGVKAFGYRNSGDMWRDPSECYYWGTDITHSGNKVRIEPRTEA